MTFKATRSFRFVLGVGFGFCLAQFAQLSLFGQDAAHVFTVYHAAGGGSCGNWTLAKSGEKEELEVWVRGFVSGADYAGTKQLKATDSAGLVASMNKKCSEAPLSNIVQAAMSLVSDLGGRPFKLSEK